MEVQGLVLSTLLLSSFVLCQREQDNYVITIQPDTVRGYVEKVLNFTVGVNCVRDCSSPSQLNVVVHGDFHFIRLSENENTLNNSVYGAGIVVDFANLDANETRTIFLQSRLLGISELQLSLQMDDPDSDEVEIAATRTLRTVIARDFEKQMMTLNIVFSSVMMFTLFLMGISIDAKVVWEVLKRPIGPGIGFLSQFVIMPLCAYGIGEMLLSQDYEKLGLVLLGSSPGGSVSNFWTAMFGGDINLSVTMTFLSSVASFGMTSLWVFLLGQQYTEKDISIPYHMIAISLATFTLPLVAGCYFKYKKPEFATKFMAKLATPFFVICLLTLPAIGIYNNLYFFFLVNWNHLASGLLLGLAGYLLGGLLALASRLNRGQIIAVSLETAIQNGGIAFVVVTLTFPSPYAELGLMPIMSFFICSTGPILFVVYIAYKLTRCCFCRKEKEEEKEEEAEAEEKKEVKEEDKEEKVKFLEWQRAQESNV